MVLTSERSLSWLRLSSRRCKWRPHGIMERSEATVPESLKVRYACERPSAVLPMSVKPARTCTPCELLSERMLRLRAASASGARQGGQENGGTCQLCGDGQAARLPRIATTAASAAGARELVLAGRRAPERAVAGFEPASCHGSPPWRLMWRRSRRRHVHKHYLAAHLRLSFLQRTTASVTTLRPPSARLARQPGPGRRMRCTHLHSTISTAATHCQRRTRPDVGQVKCRASNGFRRLASSRGRTCAASAAPRQCRIYNPVCHIDCHIFMVLCMCVVALRSAPVPARCSCPCAADVTGILAACKACSEPRS